MPRILNTVEAVREAHQLILKESPHNILVGEGIPDPKGCFGTTLDLHKEFPGQVFDTPISEAGMTGICIGASLLQVKPILIHMRQDFLMYAMDQLVNNAAKWHSMFGGNAGSVPLVIKAFTGRGWGSGHQHSQNFESLLSHIPGLKVVIPSTPYNAKGLLFAAHRDPNPVIILEHRWIHHLKGEVPSGVYEVPIGKANIIRKGNSHIGVITWGINVSESLKHCDPNHSILDLQSLSPIDWDALIAFCEGKIKVEVIADSWQSCNIAYEIAHKLNNYCDEVRVTALNNFYPGSSKALQTDYYAFPCSDVPDKSFVGPF